MTIIGITGTIGAGKGTVVEYLVEQFGFSHFSVRNYLTKKLVEEGVIPNRDNFTTLANKLRADNNSASYIIEELYNQAKTEGKCAIIESIRTVGEIEKLKSKGEFYLLAVDADKKLRYKRVFARNSETDNIGFEKFVSDEDREMNSTNPNNQNLGACIKLANFTILNNGSIEELHKQIEEFIEKNSLKAI